MEVELATGRTAYTDLGSGAPLLLIHGLGADRSVWNACREQLARSHRVIAPDLLGFGESEKPQMVYRASTFVHQLVELMDLLGLENADLVGNSLGGWVAAATALHAPERVRRLVLIGPAFLFGLPDGVSAEQVARAANPRSLPDLRAYLERVLADPGRVTEEELKRRLEDRLPRGDGYAIQSLLRSIEERDGLLTGRLGEVQSRALVLHGQHDGVVPLSQSKRVASELPSGRLQVFANSGHWPQIEEPLRFVEVVCRFLSGQVVCDGRIQ